MAIVSVGRSSGGRIELPYDTSDNQDTDYVVLTGRHDHIAVLIPDLDDNANVTCQVSENTSTPSWVPVFDHADGDDLIVCKTGTDPGYFDLSKYVGGFVGAIQFHMSAAQDPGGTFVLIVKD